MKTFIIDGLTIHQVTLLDTMWSIESHDEYLEWYGELSTDDQREVDTLEELIALELMEERLIDVKAANTVITKIQSKLT